MIAFVWSNWFVENCFSFPQLMWKTPIAKRTNSYSLGGEFLLFFPEQGKYTNGWSSQYGRTRYGKRGRGIPNFFPQVVESGFASGRSCVFVSIKKPLRLVRSGFGIGKAL